VTLEPSDPEEFDELLKAPQYEKLVKGQGL
jgi:hypothetical protein